MNFKPQTANYTMLWYLATSPVKLQSDPREFGKRWEKMQLVLFLSFLLLFPGAMGPVIVQWGKSGVSRVQYLCPVSHATAVS